MLSQIGKLHTMPQPFEAICVTVHEAIRAWAKGARDSAMPNWEDAPDWMKESTKASVMSVLEDPNQKAGTQHEQWVKQKVASGWHYGPTKDADLKTHPMMVPYEELPLHEQKKDLLLVSIVRALMSD